MSKTSSRVFTSFYYLWRSYAAMALGVLKAGWQRDFPWRVMGPKWSAWCVIGHSIVMRHLLFSQRVTRDFPLKFLWWLISFETKSRNIRKIDSYDTNFLPFLLVPRHLITSNENRILVNVVNILFFSVMRDSWRQSAWCVIGTPICHPGFSGTHPEIVCL